MHIVILAFSESIENVELTINALISLDFSNKNKKIQSVLIIENTQYNWDLKNEFSFELNILNLLQDFNYNQFLNLGVQFLNEKFSLKENDYIACCNNDLEFTENWLNILNYDYPSMSPKCSLTQTQKEFIINTMGYKTAQHISGWCIVLNFKTWLTINGFDEDFNFWCADDSYRMQLKENNIEHWLIVDSIVNHVNGGSNTLKKVDSIRNKELTTNNLIKFKTKYD